MATQQSCIQAGIRAPDFTVHDHQNKEFTLTSFRGKRVLLSFHPLAWTSVCAKQMSLLESYQTKFTALDTIAVGISVDSAPSKKAWAESLGITQTRLLSDFWPHGAVAQLFGIFREKEGFSERANVIIDAEGTVELVQLYELGEVPDFDEMVTVLQTEQE